MLIQGPHDLAMLPELLCYPHGRLDGYSKADALGIRKLLLQKFK
jgi:hypothetical protein